MSNLEQLVANEIRLPSPPAIAVRILEIFKTEDFSFQKLASVIQSDPALMARVLRLANSGFYGRQKKVSSIDTAVALLGVNTLKNIALSFIILEVFQSKDHGRFDFDRFWRRSLTTAVAGDVIAGAVGVNDSDTFITNLFQDIGIIASIVCRREDYLRVLDERAVARRSLIALEREILGYDHQEIGTALLKKWGLPENVFVPIRYHHTPEAAPPEFQKTCRIMHVADRVAAIYYGSDRVRNIRKVKDLLFELFAIKGDKATQLIDSIAEKSGSLQAQFDITPDEIRPFSQILQEANDELSQLNMSYELLVIENRDAKERAERLAEALKAANERLREMASRDGLTNLCNHRQFMESLGQELARASRYGQPLAMILFDIDNFKSINDVYGHPRGDVVLKTIADLLNRTNRKSDLTARYGGEEFVMLLPGISLNGAMAKAEACRLAVEETALSFGDSTLRVTVSAGVAMWESDFGSDKYKLIEAADKALFRAKQVGRNRVSS